MTDHDKVLEMAETWLEGGHAVALATVIKTWGSAPRPVCSYYPCGIGKLTDMFSPVGAFY